MSWIYKRIEDHWSRLGMTLLPKELPIGKLCGSEIELHCLEADELWSFVGAKDCKEWVWPS